MSDITCVKKTLAAVVFGVVLTHSAFANESFSIMNDRLSSAMQDNANNNNAGTQARVSKAYNEAKSAIGGSMDNSKAQVSTSPVSTPTTDPRTSLSAPNLTHAQADHINNAFGQSYIDAKNETSISTVASDTMTPGNKVDPTGDPVSMMAGVKNDPTGTPVTMMAGVKNDPTGTPVTMIAGVKNDPTGTPVTMVSGVKNDLTDTPVTMMAGVKNDPTGVPVSTVEEVKNSPVTTAPNIKQDIGATLVPQTAPVPDSAPVTISNTVVNSAINVDASQLAANTPVQVGEVITTAGAIAATNPTAQISVPMESIFSTPSHSNHNNRERSVDHEAHQGRGADNEHSHAFGGHGYGHDNSKSEGFGGHAQFH